VYGTALCGKVRRITHEIAQHILDHRFDHFLPCWEPVSSNGFDTLGIEARLRFVDRLVLETDVSLFGHQQGLGVDLKCRISLAPPSDDIFRTHLFELELDRSGIDGSNGVGDFVANAESLVFRAPR
jgi:hypothetical protein